MPYQTDIAVKHRRASDSWRIRRAYLNDHYSRAHSSCADLRSEEKPPDCLVFDAVTMMLKGITPGLTWEQAKPGRKSKN